MPAYYVIVTPVADVVGAPYAAVADDGGAAYVFSDKFGPTSGLDDARIKLLVEQYGQAPDSALDWLNLALANTLYVTVGDPVEAADMSAARTAAQQTLDALPLSATGAQQPAVSQTRDEVMAFQRQMTDDWAQRYPAAASGDAYDPDAELELTQLMTPPVDPTQAHRWLPLDVGDTECGFCEQPADAAIHGGGADTIAPKP